MSDEKVSLIGVRADGSSEVMGQVSMPPEMKMRDIVCNFIGRPSDDPDACDGPSTCLYAMQDFYKWLLEQGWTPPPITIFPVQETP